MDINNPFYVEILSILIEKKVRFILIGGLAVSYHGYSRYTGDMDLWIEPEESNMERLYSALILLGYPDVVISDIRKNREITNPTPIKLKDDSGILKVDLMTNTFQEEFSWEECFDHSKEMEIDAFSIRVIHVNHLIAMKEKSSRLDDSLKDLVDAQELKKVNKLKG